MAEPSTRRYRRVLLQIDAATHCEETVGAAIDITARLGGELHGIFIEDADLLTVGEFDFIREIRLSSPTAHQLDRLTLEGQLRAMARSVQRQLERAASRRKVAVGFRSIRGDLLRAEEEPFVNADLVIIESTGRLHSRSYRGRLTGRRGGFASTRPTLLLKGGQQLAPYVTIISDSVEAAGHGLSSVNALLGTPSQNITMLPYGVSERELTEIVNLAEKFSANAGEMSDSKGQIKIVSVVAGDETRILDMLSPENCVVAIKTDGVVMNNPVQLDPIIISRHPVLFFQ